MSRRKTMFAVAAVLVIALAVWRMSEGDMGVPMQDGVPTTYGQEPQDGERP